jgi:hypothetical protein
LGKDVLKPDRKMMVENTIPSTNDSDQYTPTLLPSNLDDSEDSDTTLEQTIDGSKQDPEAEAALAYVMR